MNFLCQETIFFHSATALCKLSHFSFELLEAKFNNYFSFFLCADELSREEDVLEWLIENKSTGDDEDVIEEVSAKTLGTLIQNIDNLVVVFCK